MKKPLKLPKFKNEDEVRIPNYLINRVKEKANEINIPYQSLIKQYIAKGVFSS